MPQVAAICQNFLVASALILASSRLSQSGSESVDTALVLAVDASESINTADFALQMQSIASVFRDSEVRGEIAAGRNRAMLVTLVQWSTRAFVSIPWMLIGNESEADAFAREIMRTPRIHDYVNFTCLSVAMRSIKDKVLPALPEPAKHTIIDVSGNGIDNCDHVTSIEAVRDELVADGTTINGLPILEGEESWMLEAWYGNHVIGGPGGFLIPARSFADMNRAMRRKFLLEISLSYR
jgi:hypothetical protein